MGGDDEGIAFGIIGIFSRAAGALLPIPPELYGSIFFQTFDNNRYND
jgi:hypothetical protein